MHWQVTAQWMQYNNPHARIEGGESYVDVAARFIPFIKMLVKTYADTDSNLLLISLGGILTCMLPLLLSDIDNDFALRHGFSYVTLVVTEFKAGGGHRRVAVHTWHRSPQKDLWCRYKD
jgi:broad specificity phosphatase PhoE